LSPTSPWANDPNKEYKINVIMLSTGGPIKYKQAARAISGVVQEPKLTQQQIQSIQNRIKELKDKKKSIGTPLPPPISSKPPVNPIPMPQTASQPTSVPVQLQPLQAPKPELPQTPPKSSGGYLKKRSAFHQPTDDDDF
jgi:hypothetical protein